MTDSHDNAGHPRGSAGGTPAYTDFVDRDTVFLAVIDGEHCECAVQHWEDSDVFLSIPYESRKVAVRLVSDGPQLQELMLLKLSGETGPPLQMLTEPPPEDARTQFAIQMAKDFTRCLNALLVEKGDGVLAYAVAYQRECNHNDVSYRTVVQKKVCSLIRHVEILPRHYKFEEVKW